ncbi:MAG: hypothetical protein R3182_02395 [Draconibacterium sp.]|nr:hypothetical protein [Draconibacterium sp.]
MKYIIILLLLFISTPLLAQKEDLQVYIHSHNDYYRKKPLLEALEAKTKSIEIDLFLIEDKLFVAHTKREIKEKNTLEKLYIDPLIKYFNSGGENYGFHLMIDVKTEPLTTLSEIEKTLKAYSSLFSKNGVQVVISGNRPIPEDYANYADFIWFDGREPSDATGPGAERIAIISQNLSKFSRWRGEGEISPEEIKKLSEFVNQCHKNKKPVRLWNTGDDTFMYDFLISVGVDYINTDNPEKLRKYLDKNLNNNLKSR